MILRAARLSVAFFLFLRFFIDHYLVMCEVLSCSPAEIGSDHEVKFNVTNKCSSGVPRLESYEGVLTKCPNYTIREDVKERYNVTLSKENSHYNILTLLIYNISMPTSGQVVYFNLNEDNTSKNGNCTISVYQKADDLNCTFNITNEGLKVDCLSSEIYPGGPCAFDSNLKNGTFIKEDTNLNSSSKSPYVTKKCTLEVAVANLTCGLLTVNVTVYPIVTGHVDDKYKYGTQSNVLKLERPSVKLDNCKPVVKEGDNVTCRCERTDSSDIDSSIYWYDNSTHFNVSDGSVSFIANRSIEEKYYCQSANMFGWKSDPLWYRPKISFPQKITNFSVNNIKLERWANISFYCEVEEADNQSVEFTKEGKLLESSNSKTITWNITSARCNDTGVYRCSVSRYGEGTYAELNVTVCESEISYKDESPDGSNSLVTWIAIGAGSLVGTLIIHTVLFTVIIKLRMYTKMKCPNKHEVKINNSDIHNLNLACGDAESKPFVKVKSNNNVDASPENQVNYTNIASR